MTRLKRTWTVCLAVSTGLLFCLFESVFAAKNVQPALRAPPKITTNNLASKTALKTPIKQALSRVPASPKVVVVPPPKPPTTVVGPLVELIESSGKIENLKWGSKPYLRSEVVGKKIQLNAFVKGNYNRKHWNLLWSQNPLFKSTGVGPQDFEFKVPLSGEQTLVDLRAIGPLGQVSRAIVLIRVSRYKQIIARVDAQRKLASEPKRRVISASLGYSLIQYHEDSNVDMTMHMLTLKGTYQYFIVPGMWDAAVNFYISALPLGLSFASNSPRTSTTTSGRFLGVNFRVGYTFQNVKRPWGLALLAGGYYTTMFVPDNFFGFRDMAGPQVFPVLKYHFSETKLGNLYFKYSPILSGVGLLPFSQRELAVGLSLVSRLENGNSLSYSLDVADLRLFVGNIMIESQSASLSVGYGW